MSTRILLLLPTTTYRTHDFMEAARRLGVETVVGSDQKQMLEDAAPGKTVTLELSDSARAAEEIEAFARSFPIDAIVPTDESTAETAAVAAGRLGLRHNPPEAARAARYKDVLRAKLTAAGVRTPAFRLLPATADPEEAAGSVVYPCVVKPTFLSASRGVIRANDPREFAQIVSRIRLLLTEPDVASKSSESIHHLLVEEYVPGAEVAVEGLLTGGRLKVLAMFDKPDPLEGPFFEETIYVTPSRLPGHAQTEIEKVVADGARAIGLVEGPIHAELRVNERGAWLIELAARSIGGLCSRTLRFGAGLSLEELILMHARGDSVEDLDRERRPAGVMMLPVPEAGILREISGVDEARKVPGIEEVTITIPVGQEVLPLPEGSRYLGFIFARGDSPEFVEASLRIAFAALHVTIEETAS
jgi:biotin carboxylase